jgi:hypothetical protein
MLDAGVEGLGRRILSKSEDVATPDAGQATGPGDQQEAQGPHAPDDVRVGALAGAAAWRGDGVELEAPGDVVGEDAELLPGAVGAVVAGGDDVQRELALELGDRLFRAPAANEGVERGQRQRQVRGDGVVLEVPIVGGEEVELEVLRALVLHVLAVDHHPQAELPLGDDEPMLEARHAGGQSVPVSALGGQLLEGQPAPVADLDGIRTAPGGEQPQHIRLEKCGIHAEFEGHAPPQTGPDPIDQLAQKRGGLLGVVHVARPVLDPQDVAGLRDVSEQRIVAAVLAMVGIEAAKRPRHGGAGAHDGAIDIEGEPRHVQPGQRVEHQLLVELHQRPQRLLCEASQPVAHRARRRHAGQARETAHERIADQVLQMLQPPGADIRQRQQQQGEPRAAVVPAQRRTRDLQPARELDPVQVAAQQFQPAVRRELLRNERDRQIPLDHLPQGAYAQAHQRGLLESESDVGTSTLLIRGQAPLMHFRRRSIHDLLSDWG